MKPYESLKYPAIASIFCLMAAAAGAQEVTLRYSRWLPEAYVLEADVIRPWIESVNQVTEGRVKIEPTPKVVGSVPTQYDVVVDGLADVALFVPGYSPGRFPLIEGLELPFFGDDAAIRSPANWRIYQRHLAAVDAFEEVHLLSLFTTNSNQFLSTSSTPPATAGDFNGLKVRINSNLSQLTELLGGVPVSKPISETYELASGLVIDGTITPPDTAVGYKLETVMKGVTKVPGGLGASTLGLAINKSAWERISERDRAAIASVSGEALAQQAGTAQKAALDKAYEAFTAAGSNLILMTDQVGMELIETLAPIQSRWIESARSEGLADPEAMLADLKQEIDG